MTIDIVDFPIENGDFPYVKLPEGKFFHVSTNWAKSPNDGPSRPHDWKPGSSIHGARFQGFLQQQVPGEQQKPSGNFTYGKSPWFSWVIILGKSSINAPCSSLQTVELPAAPFTSSVLPLFVLVMPNKPPHPSTSKYVLNDYIISGVKIPQHC